MLGNYNVHVSAGVDPGATGLSVTPDGKPKILDIIDCTGDGDIKTSSKVEAKVEHGVTIKGMTGRDLKLNEVRVVELLCSSVLRLLFSTACRGAPPLPPRVVWMTDVRTLRSCRPGSTHQASGS